MTQKIQITRGSRTRVTSATTPAQPGYNPAEPNATWTSLDNPGGNAYPDFPATDIVRDSNGDLYVSNDFGVMILANGSSDWVTAGTGLPMVEVAGLTIVPGSRVLYAATHGRGAWKLTLPELRIGFAGIMENLC